MIEVIDSLDKLDALKPEWQRLEGRPHIRIQQTFLWIRAGWVYFSAREQNSKLRILKWQRDAQGESVIFPFYIDGKGVLRFINDRHSDYNNIVCAAGINLCYAVLEAIEWLRQCPDVKHVHLRQLASDCEALEYFSVLARGSVVYRDQGYSWLDLRCCRDIQEFINSYKKKDRKKFNTLLKRAESFDYRVYANAKGDAFPYGILYELRDEMIARGRRKAQYLTPEMFDFAGLLFMGNALEVATLAKDGKPKIAAFRLVRGNRYLCWIMLNDDAHLPTALHAKYIVDKIEREKFIYDFGMGPYGYKLGTFKPCLAPMFSLHIAKTPWGLLKAFKELFVRYTKDYLKPIVRKEG